jgi:hypothetical protein
MTILEKIAKIKADTQKVYDAGYAKGLAAGKKPVFIVQNWSTSEILILNFEEGMTWGQWIDSEYNTVGIEAHYEFAYIQHPQWGYAIVDSGYNRLFATDTIFANYMYSTSGV